ncbi:hypothetical protein SAMN02927937_02107 [Paenimyroides aquimaris]|uniref:Uncharacterized protein n=1 Tax=Paenimyroides marinum TaxID=1159016 RepID=A0A1H6LRN4_9FLAO|nr:hypothetical protein SAMN02927937_02107 [Paenimyroides aquimaris]
MKYIDILIPIFLCAFFISLYFNKKYSDDKKQLFLIIGILILIINIIRFMIT